MENKRVTKKQLRVEIATKVLELLENKTLTPGGIYSYYYYEGEQLHVCAVGAAYAAIKISSETPLEEGVHNIVLDVRNTLEKTFTPTQLELIERAYEGFCGLYCNLGYKTTAKQNERAKAFMNRHWDKTERMIAIFENIIRNGGQFKP